jgi:hypothetical protein
MQDQIPILLAIDAPSTQVIKYIAYAVAIALAVAGMWGIFLKAGKPGWAAIIPIYNWVVLLDVIGKPRWWVVPMLIPCVNLVMWIFVSIELAKVFRKGTGYLLGLIFFGAMFLALLGFGDAKYHRPVAANPGLDG